MDERAFFVPKDSFPRGKACICAIPPWDDTPCLKRPAKSLRPVRSPPPTPHTLFLCPSCAKLLRSQLVGRTVDAEATKRLEAELDAAQDYPGSARSGGIGGGLGSSKGKGASKGKRGEKGRSTGIPGGQQLPSGGGVGAGMGGGGGGGGGGSTGGDNPADGEDGRVVYRWHVDSLMSGVDMDVLPVMEEGIGERAPGSESPLDRPPPWGPMPTQMVSRHRPH